MDKNFSEDEAMRGQFEYLKGFLDYAQLMGKISEKDLEDYNRYLVARDIVKTLIPD